MISFHEPELPPGVQEAVKAVLESGWVNTGPKVRELEEAIAKRLNVSPILCLNSGTAAMEIALSLLKLEAGEEVILPAWSYVSAAHAIIHQGGIPVFADIQEDFTIDLQSVAEKINSKTRAVIGVDIAGLPCDYAELKTLVQSRNPEIKLIADAAHSFGAEISGDSAALFADLTAYSFHLLKNFTTIEGGALALTSGSKSEKDSLLQECKALSLHGQDKSAAERMGSGTWEYDIVSCGYKFNMTDLQAAIGLAGLGWYFSTGLPKRKELWNRYYEAFKEVDWAVLPVGENTYKKGTYHLFLLRIKEINYKQRNEIIERIKKSGVSLTVHFKPVPLFTYYKAKGYDLRGLPKTSEAWDTTLSLPVYTSMTSEIQEEIISVCKLCIQTYLAEQGV